ncbi:MAG TPA: rhodanese-like domain-containing protein [Gemmatimonadaceae bacterium]|nr:rhodanese-like domain-containing protein [Gemmatimonadaceae bacterium]
MILKRFYDESLAQASYLIGCETTREAIVVDPGLELEEYERAAAAERLRIAHVAETHIHADYFSGARALAERLGATLHLSAEGGAGWGYTSAALSAATPLKVGLDIRVGDVWLEALHTPGHTPEHITFVVTDRNRGIEPVGALTGDFIFVGDVGRPDLLERSAGVTGNAERSASQLYQSVQSFKSRPDHLQIWPGHGAGSACGKSLGALPHTTLGYERLYNWAFEAMSEREFVARALKHQPVPPRYFSEMKRINRDIVPLPSLREPAAVRAEDIRAALERGDTVVDTSPAARFRDGHVPGAINVPLGKSFLTWMGALVPYERDLFLVVEGNAGSAAFVTRQLRKIGLVRVAGYAGREVVGEWSRRKVDPDQLDETDVRTLDERMKSNSLQVVDVRSPDEWSAGHLPGAIHIPLAALPDRFGEIDAGKPVVVHCQGGGRSAIAASYLKSHGLRSVANLRGGFDAWVADDLPVEREA